MIAWILLAIAAVILVAYITRRRARLRREEKEQA
jgi:cytochrome oxidase assembly protein ShyY1